MNKLLLLLFCLSFDFAASAQNDSIRRINTAEISIEIRRPLPGTEFLQDQEEFQLVAGRKTHLLRPDSRTADLTSGLYRQVFARVAGISIHENDGSGIQTSVASRGLSPNRSWEFNMRQDGADMAAEAFGYPEAYYSPPLEAVEKIEIIRGAASLAYGPQFGGMLNYRIRKTLPGAPLRFSSSQTLGSFGTFNSYQSLSGSAGKFFWTAWLHHRNAEGWRENSRYFTRTGFISLGYAFRPGLVLEFSSTLSNMLSQQAGGLFDNELKSAANTSHRGRNWLSTPWQMGNLCLRHELSDRWKYEIRLFGNYSDRNSVGYVKALTIADSLNALTGQFNTRTVDRDFYRNAGLEFRSIFQWKLAGKAQVLSSGLRVYSGHTLRKSGGTGSSGSNYDLSLSGDFAKNLQYGTRNLAFFAEQQFLLGKGFSLTPGARLEYLYTSRSGRIAAGSGSVSDNKKRIFPLLGISASWKNTQGLEIYGSFSQAYRPVTFSELTPAASTESIDPNLEDSKGFNAELGTRGSIAMPGEQGAFLTYDVNAFSMSYLNKIGLLGNLKTNIGDARSQGVETLVEIRPLALFQAAEPGKTDVSFFATATWMRAAYLNWKDKAADRSGKKVEYAPEFTLRSGIQLQWKNLCLSGTWNYTSAVYTDAMNSENPASNAQTGKLTAWKVLDASVSFGFLRRFQIKAGVNNLLDARYATRRSGGYPGPGLLPGQARNGYAGLSVNF